MARLIDKASAKVGADVGKVVPYGRRYSQNKVDDSNANQRIEFNVAVLLTNQVQSDPGASALFASADG